MIRPPTRSTLFPTRRSSDLWQRLLQLPGVRVEDNFFDLGGDSSLAVELFNEIAKVCGRELSPVTVLGRTPSRSEEHTSELQSHSDLVCRLLLEKKKKHGALK